MNLVRGTQDSTLDNGNAVNTHIGMRKKKTQKHPLCRTPMLPFSIILLCNCRISEDWIHPSHTKFMHNNKLRNLHLFTMENEMATNKQTGQEP